MNLEQAVKAIRKELVIKEEPLKAIALLELFKNKVNINDELVKTKKMCQHFYDKKEWKKMYDISVEDAESIETIEVAVNAGPRYLRYQWVIDNLKKDKAKSYLDLGCYVGSLVTTAAAMGIKSYGVDYTSDAIKKARRRNEQVEQDAKFFIDDASTFNKQKAEHVSALEIIEHVVDPEAFIENMLNLSTKWCYISTPDGPYENGQGIKDMGWEWKDNKDYRTHLRVYTQATMRELLKDCDINYMQTYSDGLLHTKFKRKE